MSRAGVPEWPWERVTEQSIRESQSYDGEETDVIVRLGPDFLPRFQNRSARNIQWTSNAPQIIGRIQGESYAVYSNADVRRFLRRGRHYLAQGAAQWDAFAAQANRVFDAVRDVTMMCIIMNGSTDHTTDESPLEAYDLPRLFFAKRGADDRFATGVPFAPGRQRIDGVWTKLYILACPHHFERAVRTILAMPDPINYELLSQCLQTVSFYEWHFSRDILVNDVLPLIAQLGQQGATERTLQNQLRERTQNILYSTQTEIVLGRTPIRSFYTSHYGLPRRVDVGGGRVMSGFELAAEQYERLPTNERFTQLIQFLQSQATVFLLILRYTRDEFLADVINVVERVIRGHGAHLESSRAIAHLRYALVDIALACLPIDSAYQVDQVREGLNLDEFVDVGEAVPREAMSMSGSSSEHETSSSEQEASESDQGFWNIRQPMPDDLFESSSSEQETSEQDSSQSDHRFRNRRRNQPHHLSGSSSSEQETSESDQGFHSSDFDSGPDIEQPLPNGVIQIRDVLGRTQIAWPVDLEMQGNLGPAFFEEEPNAPHFVRDWRSVILLQQGRPVRRVGQALEAPEIRRIEAETDAQTSAAELEPLQSQRARVSFQDEVFPYGAQPGLVSRAPVYGAIGRVSSSEQETSESDRGPRGMSSPLLSNLFVSSQSESEGGRVPIAGYLFSSESDVAPTQSSSTSFMAPFAPFEQRRGIIRPRDEEIELSGDEQELSGGEEEGSSGDVEYIGEQVDLSGNEASSEEMGYAYMPSIARHKRPRRE